MPQLYSASLQMICNMPTRADKHKTKEQYIAAVMKGPPRYESFTFSEVKIVFYGKAAVLTGYCDVKMVGRDSFRVRTLQVYVEKDKQWRMAAHQSTRMGG